MKKIVLIYILFAAFLTEPLIAQQINNKPERVNWFQDLGFEMFIRWNVNVQKKIPGSVRKCSFLCSLFHKMQTFYFSESSIISIRVKLNVPDPFIELDG